MLLCAQGSYCKFHTALSLASSRIAGSGPPGKPEPLAMIVVDFSWMNCVCLQPSLIHSSSECTTLDVNIFYKWIWPICPEFNCIKILGNGPAPQNLIKVNRETICCTYACGILSLQKGQGLKQEVWYILIKISLFCSVKKNLFCFFIKIYGEESNIWHPLNTWSK